VTGWDGERRSTTAAVPPAIGHPRPLLRREDWWSLDGPWDFAMDADGEWEHPDDVAWSGTTIVVPFAPETPASGIGATGYLPACWYRRTFQPPPARRRERVVLHFGAVDHECAVWVDGVLAVRHEGGYSPFSADITRAVRDGGTHTVVVRAVDDPLDLAKPRGKQDWELEAHSIWYPRTTGIWQTVWLERLPEASIASVQWSADLDRTSVTAELRIDGPFEDGCALRVRLSTGDRMLVDDHVRILGSRLTRGFVLEGTGVDHLRDALTWTPDNPVLVDAVLELVAPDGRVIDRVHSYTALRTISTRAGRFLLNGRPCQMRLVLDQGYWPTSGLTPPDDQALRSDLELVKAMGFNGVRKHQKIEDPRFLHWADRLGVLVWYEMPPAYRFDAEAIRRVTAEWLAAVERDRSHPCIVAWVPFNESTGVLSLLARADQRDWVRALTRLTKALDPTRPVISNDGWETIGGDVVAVHDYDQDPVSLVARWTGDVDAVLRGFAHHGRLQTLDLDGSEIVAGDRPIVLSEIGGIGWAPDAPVDRETPRGDGADDRLAQPAAWGYSTVGSVEELAARYVELLRAVHAIEGLAGFCYTQLADTYQEVNGLLQADRTPKMPLDVVAVATRGAGKSYLDPVATSTMDEVRRRPAGGARA
jgi:hypothetical protein